MSVSRSLTSNWVRLPREHLVLLFVPCCCVLRWIDVVAKLMAEWGKW